MNTISEDLLNKIYNPILICDRCGQILHINFIMNSVFDYVKIKIPKKIQELDMNFNYNSILENEPIHENILINNFPSPVNIYSLRDKNNSINIMYMFDTSIINNKTIDNVINDIDEVVAIFNKDGLILKMNSLCDDILPFTRSQAIGKTIYELARLLSDAATRV
jgi:PAS domain-containing protein